MPLSVQLPSVVPQQHTRTSQIGTNFQSHIYRHHETHSISYRPAKCLVGISVGLFAAAAVAVSESLSDLISYGAESVRTAFTFCVHVQRVSQLLETSVTEQATPVSWATVVIGVPAETIRRELDRFNGAEEVEDTDTHTRPLTGLSISHVDDTSVGITGPPTRLKELFRQSEMLRSSRHSALPISGGLCHVPNVYGQDDVRAILEAAEVWERWGARVVQVPIVSPCTGSPFLCSDASHLIKAICTEALTRPLYFDKLAGGVATQLSSGRQPKDPSCQILHYRATVMSDTIIANVISKLSTADARRQCLVDWAVRDNAFGQLQHGPTPPQTAKLAVVGMSCRMPGSGGTPERFWELLVNGVDTLTTVPPDRFDLDAHFDSTMEKDNTVGTRFGNFIDNPGYFDAAFFNMSPREVRSHARTSRVALVSSKLITYLLENRLSRQTRCSAWHFLPRTRRSKWLALYLTERCLRTHPGSELIMVRPATTIARLTQARRSARTEFLARREHLATAASTISSNFLGPVSTLILHAPAD